MARKRQRTQPCGSADARRRLADAASFLEVGQLVADERDPKVQYASVAASLAVLAGIAAVDAACCYALGERSRSQRHAEAADLLGEIPGGEPAAKRLRQLLALKDAAQYGLIPITTPRLKTAIRGAEELVEFANEVLRG